MEVPEIIEAISIGTGKFALEAVQSAIACREDVTPALLAILEDVAQRGAAVDETGNYIAPLYAMFLLAQFREKRAYPIIVRILRLPADDLDLLLGDLLTERLQGILASVFDGDLAGIESVIQCETANIWARCAALSSLVVLVQCGALSREAAVVFLRDLLTGKLPHTADSIIWSEVVCCASDLHARELLPFIERAYRERLVDPGVIRLEDVRRDFARDEEWAASRLANDPHKRLVEDVVKEFGSWYCFHRDEYDTRRGHAASLDDPEDAELPEWYSNSDEYLVDRLGTARRTEPKVGRNEPCPCGSGKKYKKCCGT